MTAVAPPPTLPLPPRLRTDLSPAERPIELVELHVSVEASGSLAVTTWELVFYNPNGRVLEGRLEFPLLEGQTVVRFATEVDGALREAVPVPKDKGRQVFEEIVRRQVDPALLEKTEGNNYRARIYPLVPGQAKRVVVAYQEEIALGEGGAATYRLGLDFPAVRRFTFALSAPGASPAVRRDTLGLGLPAGRPGAPARVERENFVPRGLLELALPLEAGAVTTQEFAGEIYFRAEQALEVRSRLRAKPRVVGLLWDSSGSGTARDVGREFDALGHYFQALGGALEVRLVRLRHEAEPAERFAIEGGDWSALRRALEATPFDGATSLGAFQPESGVDAWLLCGDGLSNFGASGARPDAGGAPVHVLLSAVRADPARLRAVASESGGEFVDLTELSAEAAAARLLRESERLLALEASPREAAQVFPQAPAPLRSSRLLFAGMLRADRATLRAKVGFADAPGEARVVEIVVRADAAAGGLAARAWAALKIEALEPYYDLNEADIEWTGQTFGLVTRSTSLILLERAEDYARYDIEPPAELRAAWGALRKEQWRAQDEGRARRLERLASLFRGYVAWWERAFPEGPRAAPAAGETRPALRSSPSRNAARAPTAGAAPADADVDDLADTAELSTFDALIARAPAPPMGAPAPAPFAECEHEESPAPEASFLREEGGAGRGGPGGGGPGQSGSRAQPEPAQGPRATIQLQRWSPDAPYLERLGAAPPDRLYDAYLAERPAHARSTAFFLDAADLFFERGLPALGLRALSNLAEMELENPAVLRILGYRLLQAGRADLARPVFERVKALRPEEPQSLRDLSQACAALGDLQAAVDLLWDVATGAWHARFPEIELLALIELNALVARAEGALDLGRVDPQFCRALPLDLRVVLTWDADETDIDLWVTDPAGEKAYFAHPLTQQGGRMSPDFRDGYGPEEFSLRRAAPGEYRVEVNFYGNRQQIIAGATTVQLQFVTGFGGPSPREERVTLRLRDVRDVVTVGRFRVGGPAAGAGPGGDQSGL